MLIIFHSNASIVLMKHDLQRPISSLKKTGTDLVLWNQTRSVENSDKLIATESLSIIKLEDSKIVARLSRIETKLSATGADDSHSITTNDFSLDFKDPITPIAYAFVADQKKLFVARTFLSSTSFLPTHS
ncbi:hypothetical protein BCR33DRAFT_300399 [Rhizoclosmatium globosum]|uniref:Uncharacterized protein n=1 Tax=Rhizoclosmatium globosum TaxID=329046 RepID=A0A1Y2C6G0_9FUNG|nr:hypothetical protein BCR33DRAFT_300399 [Rhizoclosmatium globosum]|eukprot:ORY42628.1 hypothetical protein BCR33DRAFT_300399 [Rhizoclosmatium globosum]